MYCIPHILHIPKTLIPTPSPTRAPASSRSIAIERPPHTQTHPESCPLSPSPPPPRSARRSASPRAAPPAPRSPAAPSSRDTPSPWKPRRARKPSSARTTRTSSTRPRYARRADSREIRLETRGHARRIFFVCASIARCIDSEDRRQGARERVRIPRGVDRDRDRYPSIISRVFPLYARSVYARARAHRLTIFTRVRLFPRRAGGRHRPPVLVPRGRLLLVRGQGHGACATRSLTSSDEP